MKMQMVVAHGGHRAKSIMFGDNIRDGGKDDLEKITKVWANLYLQIHFIYSILSMEII